MTTPDTGAVKLLPPIAVDIFLHHYTSPEPYAPQSKAYDEWIEKFNQEGLLLDHHITDKGKNFLGRLLSTPLTERQPDTNARALEEAISEQLSEKSGFWNSCSGCYESSEGAPPNGAFFSPVFKCYLGIGCSECGGIGAIWDNHDYSDIGYSDIGNPTTPPQGVQPTPSAQREAVINELIQDAKWIAEDWKAELDMQKVYAVEYLVSRWEALKSAPSSAPTKDEGDTVILSKDGWLTGEIGGVKADTTKSEISAIIASLEYAKELADHSNFATGNIDKVIKLLASLTKAGV